MRDRNRAWLEFIKSLMKPGFLYGIGEDGELYCIEVDMPKTGQAGQRSPDIQNKTKE